MIILVYHLLILISILKQVQFILNILISEIFLTVLRVVLLFL